MHKYQIQLSEELTPSILSLFKKEEEKKAFKAGACWHHRPFHLTYRCQIEEKHKKERTETIT